MNDKNTVKNLIKFSLSILPVLLFSGCLSFSFSGSINNVWKVPNTNLSITVEKASAARNEFTRTVILQDNYINKNKIALAKGMNAYSRVNIYQIGENEYVLRDVFEAYLLNTQAKTLTKANSSILSLTFEDTRYPKFIGAFDDNESGNWRYIPASERKEIPLTTVNVN